MNSNEEMHRDTIVNGDLVKTMKRRNLSSNETRVVVSALLLFMVKENNEIKLQRGALSKIARDKNVPVPSVWKIWKRALANFITTGIFRATPQKEGRCGRKPKYNKEELVEAMEEVEIERRQCLRDTASAIGIPPVSLWNVFKKEDEIYRVNLDIKPLLSDQVTFKRILYAASRIETTIDDNNNKKYFYNAGYFEVHIDEKWFFLQNPKRQKAYVSRREIEENLLPKRTSCNKQNPPKLMFITAVARPMYDKDGNCIFDGKIGIWPFANWVNARRTSIHRPAGTPELKNISVTYDTYLRYFVERILPTIKAKFTPLRNHDAVFNIKIQHDNAPAHFDKRDQRWIEASTRSNLWNFELINQPARSPDTNINDLGFFTSIQNQQRKKPRAANMEALLQTLELCFDEYDPEKLDRLFVTHQCVMNSIIENHGDNNFKMPSINKDKIIRETGSLPSQIEVSEAALEVLESLNMKDDL